MRDIVIIIAVFILIWLFVIGSCYFIFGDISETNSFKPLWVIIPAMVMMLIYLIYKTNSK